MAEKTLPRRSEIPEAQTWNAPSVFVSRAAWEAEYSALKEIIPDLPKQFQGHLGTSPDILVSYLETFYDLYGRLGKLFVYASMFAATDTADQESAALEGQAMSLYSQLMTAAAFAEPELIAIGHDTLKRWMQQDERLAVYAHYFDNLFRQQAHVRSAEVEEVLGLAMDPVGSISNAATVLSNAELKFAPAITADGETVSVEQGNVLSHVLSPDRELRRSAEQSYRDGYLAFKNTLASNLTTAIKADVFFARARRYNSSLEASLASVNIPVEVFYNLINTFHKHLPTWHRYWAIRRQALGVEKLYWYDTLAPLTDAKPEATYEQAVEWICEGMAPLGEDYVVALRRGCLHDRWVDYRQNQNKRQGAFSSGSKGTHPFIMMSFNGSLQAVSTLAHELGHSLHSYHTWQHQPMVYSDYSLFVAEVASNFNQALVRAHLLKTHGDDPGFQIAVIEEAMYNFRRYFFLMPTLARFELEVHTRTGRGEGVTADQMINLMADLLNEGYGDAMELERERDGIMWTEFGHLYETFYVYQYATGISAAHALADGVLSGKPGAAQNYLSFLKAGGSLYPLDALKLAGVDMATPDAVEKTYAVLAGYVDRLEKLTGAQ
jgi:oligoendopeptidase F